MAGIRLFNVHYGWEDCLSMALGALIVLTSWLVGDGGSQTVAVNAVIVGILVLALGASEVVDLRRWEESLEAACGLWLIASPLRVRLRRCWHAPLLALRARHRCRAASGVGTAAGLGAERR